MRVTSDKLFPIAAAPFNLEGVCLPLYDKPRCSAFIGSHGYESPAVVGQVFDLPATLGKGC